MLWQRKKAPAGTKEITKAVAAAEKEDAVGNPADRADAREGLTPEEELKFIKAFHDHSYQPHPNVKSLRRFSYDELRIATSDFSKYMVSYHEEFGTVYMGYISSLRLHAFIKRYGGEDETAFLVEVCAYTMVSHPNVIKCIGWCKEGKNMLIVLEHFLIKESLHDLLLPGRAADTPPWEARYAIALDLASAVLYLHDHCDPCVLHGHISARNVVVDSTYAPKLSCFELATFVNRCRPDASARSASILGFLRKNTAYDVYYFGLVALEIAVGRPPTADLLRDVRARHAEGRILDAADGRLAGRFDRSQMEALLMVGLLCTDQERMEAPMSMRQVVQLLKMEEPVSDLQLSPSPVFVSAGAASALTGEMAQEDGQCCIELLPPVAPGSELLPPPAPDPEPLRSPAVPFDREEPSHHDRGVCVMPELDTILFDVGIPVDYESSGPLKDFHLQIMRGFVSGLKFLVESRARYDEVMEAVKQSTAALLMFRTPLDGWNSLVQFTLGALKQIDDLKEKCAHADDGDPAAISSLRAAMERHVASIQRDGMELADAKEMLASIEQEHASLQGDYNGLKKYLVELQLKMENLEESWMTVGTAMTVREERREFLIGRLEVIKAKHTILTLYDSIMCRISSF